MLGIDELIVQFVKSTGESWLTRRRNRLKAAQTKKYLREKIRRELRITRECLDAFYALDDKDRLKEAFEELNTPAMEGVFTTPVALDQIFNQSLRKDLKETIAAGRPQYERWIANIQTEAQLFELIWVRLSVIRTKAAHNLSLGDVRYLLMLMLGLQLSLAYDDHERPTHWLWPFQDPDPFGDSSSNGSESLKDARSTEDTK